jgi:hypothetical protein
MLPDIDVPPYSTIKPVKQTFKKNPKWPEIHADIVTTSLTPKQICEKYDLRTESGSLAIIRVAKYRRDTLERFKDLFARANELEQSAIKSEVLGKMREIDTTAAEAIELAKHQKKIIGRGKNTTEMEVPDFGAMRDHLEVRMNVNSKLAEIAGVGPEQQKQQQAPVYQDNRVTTILALPKQENVPSRAPLRILDAKKAG